MGAVERHGSGGPFEPTVGYSRVVRAGDLVVVAGTHRAHAPTAWSPASATPYQQTRQALENVAAALERVGAGLADVVRTRDVRRRHRRAGTTSAAPTARCSATSARSTRWSRSPRSLDPRMLVEIEADAYLTRAVGT